MICRRLKSVDSGVCVRANLYNGYSAEWSRQASLLKTARDLRDRMGNGGASATYFSKFGVFPALFVDNSMVLFSRDESTVG